MHNANQKTMILIADSDIATARSISNHLADKGYSDVRIVHDLTAVYQHLRSFYQQPESVGPLIISEQLAGSRLLELCHNLSTLQDSHRIPLIIIGTQQQKNTYLELLELSVLGNDDGFVYFLNLPLNINELLMVVQFQLAFKQERCLRLEQEEVLMTELAERKVIDAKLKYLVAHDELTGLLNRQNFEQHLKIILQRNDRLFLSGVLLYIDIDRFSLINELEGYDVGDRLLVELVAVIRIFVDKTNCFTRIGSDDFCLYLEKQTITQSQQFAETIRQAVENFRFFVGDSVYNPTVSIGMASVSVDKDNHPSALISHARQACRIAKENGRNRVWEYNASDSGVLERQHDVYWAPLIRNALIDAQFFLLFQPVVDLRYQRISHYEVLLRMQGKKGTVSPAVFIPVAERMGLIRNVDLWVVENAIDYLAALPTFMSQVCLAINLSSTAFQDMSLLMALKNKLKLTWIDPSRLIFEITETAAVENFEQSRNMILKIRALGCKFALDDFGAGFCSFNYLKKFPVDYIKIDGQFIHNLIDDETDQVLVRSIVEVANKLGKKTIAEFVENAETVDKLLELGVDFAQGYVFGKPEQILQAPGRVALHGLAG